MLMDRLHRMQALDAEGAVILINNICTSTGAWEPKPFARKVRLTKLTCERAPAWYTMLTAWLRMQECIRTLGQMVGPECPVRDLILQQYLGKLVAYLKRHMQVGALQLRCNMQGGQRALAFQTHTHKVQSSRTMGRTWLSI